MLLAIANAATKNARFDSALDRTFKYCQALQSQLKAVEIDGPLGTLGFVIADRPANYFRVVPKPEDGIFQVVVGYNLTADYPREEDDKLVKVMADWLRRVFLRVEDYASKQTELLGIVNCWEGQSIKCISLLTVR